MKKIQTRKRWIIIACVLAVSLLAGGLTMLILHRRDAELDRIQDEALQELYDHRGQYDEQSIVLSDTTRSRAETLAKAFGAKLRITSDGSFAALTLPEGVTVFDVYENKSNRAYIQYMSLDYHATISDVLASDETDEEETYEHSPARPQYSVTDTEYERQVYLDYINMSTAWATTQGSNMTVAVIDTGIDTDHPEFAGRISEYSYNASQDRIVKDWTVDGGAYDWSLIEDEQGHGTAVAGVLAAAMDGSGVVGIAPRVNIIVIKAECNENGEFKRTSDLVFGLYYAIERDVAVVNMSFVTKEPQNPFAEATRLAVDSDVICIAAAGNDARAGAQYPAADENVFGVGALADGSFELADYSNYGENVDLVAPGTVYTAVMGGGYGRMQGTSFSAPIVSGAVALYMARNSYSEFLTVQEMLRASCYDLGELGPDWYYGYGALDVSALILEERGRVTFNMMTDELNNREQVFIRNHTLQDMPVPERLYAVFDGWYYDPQCTEEYAWYEDELSADLTLYANWVNEEDGIPYIYVELEDGTIEIRAYTGHRRYITIPDSIEGKEVSSIGQNAFSGNTTLREVIFPKHLKRIRNGAFMNCSNLVSVAIPDSVTEIGSSAFSNNVRLSTVILGENSQLVSIGGYAFQGCVKMRTFTVPSKVEEINGSAFYGTVSMMAYDVMAGNVTFSVEDGILFKNNGQHLVAYPAGLSGTYTIPDNVDTIGGCAFAYTRLTAVELSRVQTIGDSAFAYGDIRSIVIPDSVTSMGKNVFKSNVKLASVVLGAGLTELQGHAFENTALTSIQIPAKIRIIEAAAFSNIGVLAEVEFEVNSCLTRIEAMAFAGSGIASLDVPASVEVIAMGAFGANGVANLTSVTFEEGSSLRTIEKEAFEGQYQLSDVLLTSSLTSIGEYAFSNTGLQTVTIPVNLTSLGSGAFASCHSLTEIAVDSGNVSYTAVDGVLYDGEKTTLLAYPAGRADQSFTIPEGTVTVGNAAFEGSWNLTEVYFAQTVETVEEKSFFNCQNVTRYTLSEVLISIKQYAFSGNYALPSITLPDSLRQIGPYAFEYDWNLHTVTFGENSALSRIGYGAFANCGLTTFRVPASVSTMGQDVFSGCTKLKTITFAANSLLESISAYMFDGCDNLESVRFEAGSALTSIQAHGMEGMRKLTSIDFGDAALTNIDNFAFRFCESLTSFHIPEGVTFVGRYAFYYCANLSEITLPSTLEYIGRFAFLGTKDVNLYFAAEALPATLANDWDHGAAGYYLGVSDVVTDGDWVYAVLTSGNIAIIEYTGSATAIDLTELDFGGDIVNIGGGAFADSSVESVVLPETLRIIQAEAFYHSELKAVTIPAGVTFIGREAFAYTPIESLTFAPDAVIKTIEQSAFEKTQRLEAVTIPESVTTLGRAVFKSSGITSLTFAEGFSMTEIPEEAFAYTHIASVTIPDSVTTINHNAFREIKELRSVYLGSGENLMIMSNVFYRTGLESLYIPANVGYIGEYAFVGLSELTAFEVAEDNPYYTSANGMLLSKDGRKLISVPAGLEGSMTLPAGVEVIGFGAFEDSRLSEIRFLDDANILTLGYRAFYNADAITEIRIPAGVIAIDYYAFAMCDNLTTVIFAEENLIRGIYEGAFYGCKSLSDIMLPDTVVEISDFAFYGCRKLTSVPVSDASGIKGIYDYAFAYTGISGDLTTPNTLIDIGAYAFMGNRITSATSPDTNYRDLMIGIGVFEECLELEEITIPFIGESFEDRRVTWLGYFFGSGGYYSQAGYVPESLRRVTVSEGISFIGSGGFYNLYWLEELSIPHSVQTIYNDAFYNVTATYTLTNSILAANPDGFGGVSYVVHSGHFGTGLQGHLTLAEGVTRIEWYSLGNMPGLTSVTFPETLTYIGQESFYATGVTHYVLPAAVSVIGEHAFNPDGTVEIAPENPCFFVRDGIVYDKPATRIIHLPTVVSGDVTVAEGVTEIDYGRFQGNTGITSIHLPDSVSSIGGSAFSGCTSLKSINIPEKVTEIADSTFRGCTSLEQITLHDGIKVIGDAAFNDCSSLASIDVGDGLIELGDGVLGTPELTLVLKTVLTDDLKFVMDAFLFVWTHWLLEGSAEVVARHLSKGQATTDNR